VRCFAAPGAYSETSIHWDIVGFLVDRVESVSEGMPRDLVLVGDFHAHSESEAVAVSVELQVGYPDGPPVGLRDNPEMAEAEVNRIGTELQHILYDLAAGTARSLVALTYLDVEVPVPTLEAKIRLLSDKEEATDLN
jgi:hypothetical protein